MALPPRQEYGGMAEQKLPIPARINPTTMSSHIMLSMILAERGTEHPVYVNAETANHIYGENTFRDNTVHYIHQNEYLHQSLKNNGSAISKRIILPDAKKALLRVSLEVASTDDLPIYEFDENWQPVQVKDESGVFIKKLLRYTSGARVVVHTKLDIYPAHRRGFAAGEVISNYRVGAVGTGASTLLPILDLEVIDYGAFANDWTAHFDTDPYKEMLLNPETRDMGILPASNPVSGIGITNREYGWITPNYSTSSHYARYSLFEFGATDEDGYDNYVERSLKNAFAIPVIGRAHVYKNNVSTLRNLLASQEFDLIEEILEEQPHLTNPYRDVEDVMNQFDLIRGKNRFNNFYIVGDWASSDAYGGAGDQHGLSGKFEGGSDGYPLDVDGEIDRLAVLQLYDEACRIEFAKFAEPNHVYRNIARFPYTVFYDSGYAMRTKLEAFKIRKYRPEVTLIMSAFSVADYSGTVEPPIPPFVISCVGAQNISGCIELHGHWDIQIDGETVAGNLDVQGIMDYLNDTGDYDVMECVGGAATIECDGATEIITWSGNNGWQTFASRTIWVFRDNTQIGVLVLPASIGTPALADMVTEFLNQFNLEINENGNSLHNLTGIDTHVRFSGNNTQWSYVSGSAAYVITDDYFEFCLSAFQSTPISCAGATNQVTMRASSAVFNSYEDTSFELIAGVDSVSDIYLINDDIVEWNWYTPNWVELGIINDVAIRVAGVMDGDTNYHYWLDFQNTADDPESNRRVTVTLSNVGENLDLPFDSDDPTFNIVSDTEYTFCLAPLDD